MKIFEIKTTITFEEPPDHQILDRIRDLCKAEGLHYWRDMPYFPAQEGLIVNFCYGKNPHPVNAAEHVNSVLAKIATMIEEHPKNTPPT